jgi:polyketide synthase
MSRVLVTGATGFIGRHLTERLVGDGKSVRVLCRPQSIAKLPSKLRDAVEIIPGDLRDKEAVQLALKDISKVFHCAGHVSDWGSEATFSSTNTEGTRNLLQASARVDRFVHLSSIAVFGVPSPPYFDDDSPYGAGTDPYSKTKIEGEKIAFDFFHREGRPVTVLRPPVVYGRHGTWAEEPMDMIRKHKMFLIGGGKGTCHPCFVDNLVDALLLVANHPKAVGQAYIVGDDEPLSFQQYFDRLAGVVGAGPIRRSLPLPLARLLATGCEATARLFRRESRPLLTHTAVDMITRKTEMSMAKIKRELGFKPRFTVAEAMSRLKTQLA